MKNIIRINTNKYYFCNKIKFMTWFSITLLVLGALALITLAIVKYQQRQEQQKHSSK